MFGPPRPTISSASSTPNLFSATAPGSTPAKPLGSTAAGGSSMFNAGANKNVATNSMFSTTNQAGSSSAQGMQATSKPLFGSTTPASTPASKPPGQTFPFGTTPTASQPASSQPSMTAAKPFALSGPSSNTASSGTPASNLFGQGTPNSSGATATSGLFNLGGNKPLSSTPPSTSAASGSTGTPNMFSLSGSKPPPSTAPLTGPPPVTTGTSNLFGLGGSTSSSAGPSASTTTGTTAAGPGAATTASSAAPLFPNAGVTSTATSSAPAPTPFGASLFGGASSKTPDPSTTTSAEAPATSSATAPGLTAGDASKSGFASSTAGPAPSAQSRLKNKSMDEIITRWAADLSKYQKEFQSQAETVAQWDRALVENSDKVKQLYAKTFQAERDAAEVEKQLTNMEENQQELDAYLDRYEKDVENLMRKSGVGGNDSRHGPDQEREQTYKLAEKLQDRLNELNKDLTEMIEEINNTSQTLSKTGKPDDPLTKVVRVLNSQLSQLQLIDSGAAQLQDKINKAQKEGQRVGANGWNGLGTDPTDDFYRSFRGGRTDRFGGVS
ncbi:Nsp1-like C-terminal region-domain-containing protein [Massariosphaeria phaeospora]|uniref:Nucleoporin NSP1 n=1 Tax=Massariosphaeria phaeospora TaxID=100035 RepID=A0A7C8M085_9PLEO|nr:Nsp1-like C-terminal region-domain-containing protein [Massariosphaeria phaeospora]